MTARSYPSARRHRRRRQASRSSRQSSSIPGSAENPIVYSLANQMLIAITAAFSVYIMLRMNLMTFAVPTFMAIGGYTVAICGPDVTA